MGPEATSVAAEALQCRQCTEMFLDPDLFTARRRAVKQTEG
jgi:hypothetical protein